MNNLRAVSFTCKKRRDIQSILFDKKKYTTAQARNALKKDGLKPIKRVHTTKHYHRYRINEPILYKRFSTQDLKNGVKIVYGYTK